MYGTVARFKVKPGMESELEAFSASSEARGLPGHIKTYIYRMDNEPNECYMVVLFDSKESYHANAASPEQDADYQTMVSMLEGPPEWHDGEIIYESR